MLQTLHDQGDLHFDFERRKWHFKISDTDLLPANVVDLIVRGLQRLPPETQAVMKLAACIGSNKFSLLLLSVVYQHSLEETAADLWPALEAGFIVPTSNAYQIPLAIEPGSELSQQWVDTSHALDTDKHQPSGMDPDSNSTSTSTIRHNGVVVTYRTCTTSNYLILGFLHDKVQQSAMELIPESERPGVHGFIGRHLLQRMRLEGQIDGYVFEICNQLNKALDSLSPEECEQVIELNLCAGRKALKTTAFDGATDYFQVAWDLLGNNPWRARRVLALNVYLAKVERQYAAAQFEDGILHFRCL